FVRTLAIQDDFKSVSCVACQVETRNGGRAGDWLVEMVNNSLEKRRDVFGPERHAHLFRSDVASHDTGGFSLVKFARLRVEACEDTTGFRDARNDRGI